MPVLLVDGIVTRYVNYRENDRILSIFSPERGRIDAKARGCRKSTSALLPACQPFVYGQFELFSSKDKFTVNQCEVKETFFPIREDYERFRVASAILQLIQGAVQENEPNEPLFSLLYHTLSYLSYGTADPQDLFCCFFIRYLNGIGYCPAITACAQCGRDVRKDQVIRFSPRLGGAVCAACAGGAEHISKTALEGMRRMLMLSDDEMDRVKLSLPVRQEIGNALSGYALSRLDYAEKALSLFLETECVNKAKEL